MIGWDQRGRVPAAGRGVAGDDGHVLPGQRLAAAAARDVRPPLRVPGAPRADELGARRSTACSTRWQALTWTPCGGSPTPSSTRATCCGPTAGRRSRTSGAGPSAASTRARTARRIRTTAGRCRPSAWSRRRGPPRRRARALPARGASAGSPHAAASSWTSSTVDGERHVAWDEATEREVTVRPAPAPSRDRRPGRSERGGHRRRRHARAQLARARGRGRGRRREQLADGAAPRDRAHREHHAVRRRRPRGGAAADVLLDAHDPDGRRRRLRVAHRSSGRAARRGASAARTRAPGPCWSARRASATRCSSSPIILPDYPEIAPESPGDLFDGGEIDQLLVLNILSLTDEEKEEMRAADPRTREILERTESLSRGAADEPARRDPRVRDGDGRGR